MSMPLSRRPRLSTPLTSGVSRTGEWAGEISSPDEAPDPRQQRPELTRLPTVMLAEPPPWPEHRSPEGPVFSEELATRDHPPDYELEYYDDEPIRRWPTRVPLVVAFVAVTAVASLFAASRLAARRSVPVGGLSVDSQRGRDR